MRNFARGATRQELNVSWLKKNELEFKKHINEFRSYFKKNQTNLNNASRDLYFEVREILLKKTLGKKLYSKLIGNELKKQNQRQRKQNFLDDPFTRKLIRRPLRLQSLPTNLRAKTLPLNHRMTMEIFSVRKMMKTQILTTRIQIQIQIQTLTQRLPVKMTTTTTG